LGYLTILFYSIFSFKFKFGSKNFMCAGRWRGRKTRHPIGGNWVDQEIDKMNKEDSNQIKLY